MTGERLSELIFCVAEISSELEYKGDYKKSAILTVAKRYLQSSFEKDHGAKNPTCEAQCFHFSTTKSAIASIAKIIEEQYEHAEDTGSEMDCYTTAAIIYFEAFRELEGSLPLWMYAKKLHQEDSTKQED